MLVLKNFTDFLIGPYYLKVETFLDIIQKSKTYPGPSKHQNESRWLYLNSTSRIDSPQCSVLVSLKLEVPAKHNKDCINRSFLISAKICG